MANREQTSSGQSGELRDAVATFSPEPKNVPVACSRPAVVEAPICEAGPVSTWRPPATVGRYRIEGILGCGGMGQVYRAWDTELQRRVALKFILGIEPDATARERFLVEARATARLQHPNVLTIYDVDEFDGRPYLVMEFLSGKTLDKITKPMLWARVLELGLALSSGLAHAHRHGVLHRDMKPDNAMLTDDGQVKLLDFGLAKLATHLSTPKALSNPQSAQMSPPAAATLRTGGSWSATERASAPPTIRRADPPALTDTGAIVGTPGYMAPESFRGHATPQSDVYSLGALLFELCAGRAVYADVASHALSFAIQTRDAPRLTDVVPTVDPRFADIVARSLSRDPEARYASAQELYEALKRLALPALCGSTLAVDPDGRALPDATATAVKTMVFREVGALVVSVHSPETPTDVDWNAYLQLCRRKMAQGRIGVLVSTAGGGPTPTQRLAIRELLGEGPVLAAVVTDAPTVHGIIKVMSWGNPGIRTVSNLDEALTYLCIDGPMVERVLLEVRAMQRELA